MVDIHLFERAAEVANALAKVVEEGAELKEVVVDSAAEGIRKKTVSEKESYSYLLNRGVILQLVLVNANEGSGAKRRGYFGAKKLS